jgi:hypothetical protein
MAKIRLYSDFATTPNCLLNNPNISFKAKGLYGYIQSKKEGWDFSAERIAKQSKESVDSVKAGLVELETYGYLQRVKLHNDKGYFEIEYILHATSILENPAVENPSVDNPTLEKPAMENHPNNINKINSKKINSKKKNKNISSEEDSNNYNHDSNHADKVSVKLYEQNTDANCTFPILDSTEPIYDIKAKETEPKGKPKPKEIQPKDELKSKFRVEFETLWNKAGKPKLTHIGYIAINRLYEVYGYDKACFIRDYIIEMYGSNEKSIAFKKNHENAIEFYKDPNNEEPRFLIDFWNTMERFSRPNYPEPVLYDFPTEVALYAAWEWYYKGKGLEGGEIVKAVREKIKEINHPRFNKY